MIAVLRSGRGGVQLKASFGQCIDNLVSLTCPGGLQSQRSLAAYLMHTGLETIYVTANMHYLSNQRIDIQPLIPALNWYRYSETP